MKTEVTATFVNGILKPDARLPLADNARVNLTIEPIEEMLPRTTAQEAWQAIQERLKERPLHFGGQRYTRDELHERR